jgi:hypothetical protein
VHWAVLDGSFSTCALLRSRISAGHEVVFSFEETSTFGSDMAPTCSNIQVYHMDPKWSIILKTVHLILSIQSFQDFPSLAVSIF